MLLNDYLDCLVPSIWGLVLCCVYEAALRAAVNLEFKKQNNHNVILVCFML